MNMVSLSGARKQLSESTRGGTHTPGAREIYLEISESKFRVTG
jgi:hypothetical protein